MAGSPYVGSPLKRRLLSRNPRQGCGHPLVSRVGIIGQTGTLIIFVHMLSPAGQSGTVAGLRIDEPDSESSPMDPRRWCRQRAVLDGFTRSPRKVVVVVSNELGITPDNVPEFHFVDGIGLTCRKNEAIPRASRGDDGM